MAKCYRNDPNSNYDNDYDNDTYYNNHNNYYYYYFFVSNVCTRQPVETNSQGVPILDYFNDNIDGDNNKEESSHSQLNRRIP